ncbi:hypothetical protein [Methanosarcina mazei]|jgi:hypothetical protein|uniref:Uncharacterized protein n=1 Tax=Methanosarcina mazei LYC TaxID=1434114 RepID=A0A0E3RL77_METMZ|nr:hypothetical protein [Methanosarcina mazei]AKB67358.1 hypothetical protein MSMAL_0815 [Methanosarcina mazei LYC]
MKDEEILNLIRSNPKAVVSYIEELEAKKRSLKPKKRNLNPEKRSLKLKTKLSCQEKNFLKLKIGNLIP